MAKFTDRHAFNAMSLAVSLTTLGVRKGEVIAIYSEQRREFWPTAIGSICAGAVITFINITYTEVELDHTLNTSKPKYIFCSPQAFTSHGNLINSRGYIKKVFIFGNESGSSYEDLLTKKVRTEDFLAVDVESSDTVAIMYSSGTTGLPKGVMITHYNAIVCCASKIYSNERRPVTIISTVPWYLTYGVWSNLQGFTRGYCKIFMGCFEEQQFLEAIQTHRPTTITTIPHILVKLSKSTIIDQYDISSVIRIFSSSAVLSMETADDIVKRFPNLTAVTQGYGMTETTMGICSIDQLPVTKKHTVGMAAFTTVIKVVDLETRQVLGPNQPGEICVKGGRVMKGYKGIDRSETFDEEGFLRTGDLGYYDDDKHFVLVDRIKELIKYNGRHVAPAEIEGQLVKHPAVMEAGVVGLKDKDAGELPLAFIVKRSGYNITEEELQTYVALKLSDPKHLRGGVRFVNDIPKNRSGKILRRVLRTMAE